MDDESSALASALMLRRLAPVLVVAVLALAGCGSGGDTGDGADAADGGSDEFLVVDVNATFALAEGDEQTKEQFDRSCAAATELADVYTPVLLDPSVLTPDELRQQVAGLGALAMDVHNYAPFEQQDEVTALTRLVVLLDRELTKYDYNWRELEADNVSFIEILRREGIDKALASLFAWVLVNCPEGTLEIQ